MIARRVRPGHPTNSSGLQSKLVEPGYVVDRIGECYRGYWGILGVWTIAHLFFKAQACISLWLSKEQPSNQPASHAAGPQSHGHLARLKSSNVSFSAVPSPILVRDANGLQGGCCCACSSQPQGLCGGSVIPPDSRREDEHLPKRNGLFG